MKRKNESIFREIRKALVVYLVVLLLLGRYTPLFILAEGEIEGTDQTETQQTETTDPPADELEPSSESTPESEVEQTSVPEESPEPEVNTESSPTPSPTPTDDVEVDNEAEVANDVDSTAISGENSIEEPTPTPSPVCSTLLGDGKDECGPELEEQTSEPGPEPTDEPEGVTESTSEGSSDSTSEDFPAVVDSGDAISVVEAENSVNTTEVNSQVLYQTLNIFTSGDIDLTSTPLAIADNIYNQGNNNDSVINVSMIDNQNFAYLSNEVVSFANTGDNEIEGAQEAIISTRNAYSVVSLLNKVNTTIIDSVIHIITINIFGSVQGNIILPEFSTEDDCCGEVVHLDNEATVENDVDSMAISGQNSITSTEEASINTGSANSAVNLVNIVNTNLIGATFHRLFINTLGGWNGDFLGWDEFGASNGGGNLSFNSVNSGNDGDCLTCADYVFIGNTAYVVNNISSIANTGGNSINGDEATIDTGDAYSSVSIVNLVNSSIINSVGFFGFFNIFGLLDGDIGGVSLFATLAELEPEVVNTQGNQGEENSSEQESGPSVHEEGGQLEVYQTTNVGTHVLPGDTITFFVIVKNSGTGQVYDVQLDIGLIKDGADLGGGTFEIGEIEAGKGVKVTTGLVLSEEAEPGEYIAHAVASGYIGPSDDLILAYAESPFIIGGGSLPLILGMAEEAKAVGPEGEVLGAMAINNEGLTVQQKLFLLLLGSSAIFLTTRGIRERRKLALAWVHRRSFLRSKGAALHSMVMRLSSFLS